MRACLLLLVVLVYLADDFGLDVVLGAFAAGMAARLAVGTSESARTLEIELDAIGFGFLIAVFFVTTGLTLDLDGLLSDTEAMVQVPVFLVAFYSATTLPLVVAITTIAVAGGHMRSSTSAALVAAAMLSVVLFPLGA